MAYRDQIWQELNAFQPADNAFENYQTPFGYGQAKGVLDKLFGEQSDILTGKVNSGVARAKQGTGQRLMSQGINKGSFFNQAVGAAGEDVLGRGLDAQKELSIGRQQAELPLMQMENQNKFNVTQANQNQKNTKMAQLLQQLGLKSSNNNAWESMDFEKKKWEDSQPGWLSDVFSGLGQAAKIGSMAINPAGGTLFNALGLFK